MKDILTLLQEIAPLQPEALQQCESSFKIRLLKRNDFFLGVGQVCQEIGFVQQGMLRHYYHTLEKGEVTRWIALPNTFTTCLTAFISGAPGVEIIQAVEDTNLIVISYADIQSLRTNHTSFRKLWEKVLEQNYLKLENKVSDLINLSAVQRYEQMEKLHPEFIREIPQKYLASMLGIEPRHLSRIRSKFKHSSK